MYFWYGILCILFLPWVKNINLFAEELQFKKTDIVLVKEIDIDKLIDDEGEVNWFRIDDDGNIFINFLTSSKIYKINSDFKLIKNFNKNGQGPNEMIPPVSFLISKNRLEVTDENSTRFAQYSTSGKNIGYYTVENAIGEWFFKFGKNLFGIKRIPAEMFDSNARKKLINIYDFHNNYFLKDSALFRIKPIGNYLANQLSDYIQVEDSLIFVSYRYLDKIIKINLKTFSISSMGSPLEIHLKSPILGQTKVKNKKNGGKKTVFRMTGDEYVCYTSMTKFNKKIAALFWAKQPNRFSLKKLFGGNIGGDILNIFDSRKGKYLYSVKFPDPFLKIGYSPKDNCWYTVDSSYKIKKYSIKGI